MKLTRRPAIPKQIGEHRYYIGKCKYSSTGGAHLVEVINNGDIVKWYPLRRQVGIDKINELKTISEGIN